jgi:hypothetical protein
MQLRVSSQKLQPRGAMRQLAADKVMNTQAEESMVLGAVTKQRLVKA